MDGSSPSADGRIGRYQVVRRIGAGGMGELFLARASGPGGIAKQVCIKRTLPGRAMDPRAIQRFLDEARTALSLQHANVVPVFDFGRDETGLYLVMEWIDGCDLALLLGRPVPPLVAAHVAAEICKALSYAHQRTDGRGQPAGLLHCDVTPRNVLLSRLGEVRLTDFGIARATSAAGGSAGTPTYMAPEAASGEPADARSDLYSLGLVLGEMLLGRPLRPAQGREEARRAAAVPHFEGVPEEIASVARRLIAPSPDQRFPGATDVLAALMPALAAHVLHGGRPPQEELARLVAAAAPRGAVAEAGPSTEAGSTVGTEAPAGRRPRLRSAWMIAPVALALCGVGGGIWWRAGMRAGAASGSTGERSGPTAASGPTPADGNPAATGTGDRGLAGMNPGGENVGGASVGAAPRARVRIKSPGSWVAVWIDGEKRGDDVGEFEISAGRHRLRVENAPLHFRQERWFQARPGQVVTLVFSPLGPRP